MCVYVCVGSSASKGLASTESTGRRNLYGKIRIEAEMSSDPEVHTKYYQLLTFLDRLPSIPVFSMKFNEIVLIYIWG